MNKKAISNGNVTVWVVPAAGIANFKAPTPAEINAGLDITDAIAWESTTFPSATESEDIDDRSLRDKGNASTRGAAAFEADLNLFYPKVKGDVTSDYGKAYNFFKRPGVPVYLVTRVLQAPTGEHKDAKKGEWVSVYRFITDGWTDDFEGDDSIKYAVGFLTQGEVLPYTQVAGGVLSLESLSGATSVDVGKSIVLGATLDNKPATRVVKWSSSDPTKARVSGNGVVTGIAGGAVDIEVSHPAATAAKTLSVTVS